MINQNELRRLPGGAIPALLFWLGGGAVLISLVIGLQMLAVSDMNAKPWMLYVPIWGVVASIFAITLRFWRRDAIIEVCAAMWLAIAFCLFAWVKYA